MILLIGKRLHGEDGVTLVEIILSIAILGISFLMVMQYYTNSVNHVSRSEGRSMALRLAADVIEDIKAYAGNEEWSTVEAYVSHYNFNKITTNYTLKKNYTCEITTGSFDFNCDGYIGSDDDDIGMSLTVRINWDGRSVALNTLMIDR